MFDRKAAVNAFRAYTAGYDPENPMIRLKIVHTFRVAGLCGRIAGSLGMTGAPLDLAWFLGLLHDIGRFEQVRRYGTFFDAKSVDHAEFGADLLFREGLIGRFPAEGLPEGWPELSETAIRLHNKLTLPEDLDPKTRVFAEILRDADKVDIFRVVAEIPLEERLGKSAADLTAEEDLTPEVMACVYGHRCVPRAVRRTRFDNHISHGCMAFELVFDESRRIAAEQGFLDRLLAEKDENGKPIWNGKETEALRTLRQELRRSFEGSKDTERKDSEPPAAECPAAEKKENNE